MKNKLGLNEHQLLAVEKKIVNIKLNLLNNNFTFNNNNLNLDYLSELHKFLFSEFYYEDDLGFRKISEAEKNIINEKLTQIISICITNPDNIQGITSLIEEVWHLQPFVVGNTRTLIAYLKILDDCFLLNRGIDVNVNITNNPDIFKSVCGVNQEGLTNKK